MFHDKLCEKHAREGWQIVEYGGFCADCDAAFNAFNEQQWREGQ